jgi:hypothetical protein
MIAEAPLQKVVGGAESYARLFNFNQFLLFMIPVFIGLFVLGIIIGRKLIGSQNIRVNALQKPNNLKHFYSLLKIMKKIIISMLIGFLLISNIVRANIVPYPYPLYPLAGISIIPIIFLISWAFDFLFLGIIFSMLKLTIKDFGKFTKYTFVSAVGGLLIDGLMFFIPVKIISFMIVFVFLFVWNYFLAKLWVGLNEKDAIMVGMWMGFITNPVIWFNIIPFYNFF